MWSKCLNAKIAQKNALKNSKFLDLRPTTPKHEMFYHFKSHLSMQLVFNNTSAELTRQTAKSLLKSNVCKLLCGIMHRSGIIAYNWFMIGVSSVRHPRCRDSRNRDRDNCMTSIVRLRYAALRSQP